MSFDNWNVAEFLRSRTAASHNTVQAYEQDLSVFIKRSEKNQGYEGPDGANATRRPRLGSLRMHDEGCAQNRMASCLYLRGEAETFNGQTRTGTPGSDPTSKVQAPKGAQKLPRPLTREEINQLLDEDPPENPLDLRNRLIVELLYGSGLRVSETMRPELNQFRQRTRAFGSRRKQWRNADRSRE